MPKQKKIYSCNECGAQYPKWQGQCNVCGAWNSIEEEVVVIDRKQSATSSSLQYKTSKLTKPLRLNEITFQDEIRIDLHDQEFNRVLGGGLVKGSFVLLGGEPGIGKSTLILQTVMRLPDIVTLYVSGEESAGQLKMRAQRLGSDNENCLIYCETSLDTILTTCEEIEPDVLVIDSIQTIHTENSDSSPGSIAQIRESANQLLQYSKTHNVPVILIGHINKEGSIAGPKVLEHTVDVVLQFDGDKHYMYRILRSQKNRFGSTSELGIYEMQNEGLRIVDNPSEHLIDRNRDELSGITIAVAMEGVRPILIETQALVSSAIYANPQRSATGYDTKRMNMLLAVLEKRAGFKLIQKDVFLNIAGGIRISDPASDLAIITAVLSSSLDIGVPLHTCMSGEVGLSGEVRPVTRILQRIREAERLGFNRIIIPYANYTQEISQNKKIQVIPVKRVEDAFSTLFRNHN
ncbi:DNA repair protein RadA [Porphyromonas pogonae]|uniref:DNA repair protein RadA n=1 Tax=Porphyromonas pogonae TaxID=867595 RepID=UPI002E7692A6|nr:DNA repair protein RadA [Porphyromonas pogonae]